MPPPLAELTAQAQTLTSAGDLVGARRVLASVLDPADADPQRASPDLAVAATLQARILVALGDPHAARTWAGFAHAAQERLHGPRDERTVAAAAIHAAVLHRVGYHARAAQVYHQLVGQLTAVDGPDAPRVLAAEADLATAEHAAGQCTAGRGRLAEAWRRHRLRYGDAAPAGIKMLARLGALERECGRDGEAAEHLAMAQELCARYLPADHPLVRQVAALAVAPASGRHLCGRVAQSAGPGSAPGVTAMGAPGGTAIRLPGVSAVGPPGVRAVEPPGVSAVGPPGVSAVEPPGVTAVGPPAVTAMGPPGGTALTRPGGETPGRTTAGTTTGTQAVPIPRRPTVPEPADFPPDQPGQPRPSGGRHALAEGPVPAQRPAEDRTADDPYRTEPGGGDGRTVAPNTDRRLPVPVSVPEPRRSRQPFLLAAVLVGGVAAAAAVVLLTLPDATGAGGPAAGPTATVAPPPATSGATPSVPAARGAPQSLKLRDNRDSVLLTWTYPADAEGPVLISGGRVGQQQRAFQQLPAGTDDYVVYGLNDTQNYCFTVAVVYATDRIAGAGPVCTGR